MRQASDSLISRDQRAVAVNDALLTAGDSLPSVRLRTSRGINTNLRDLPAQHYRYIYFYRPDCPPCQLLDSVWVHATPARRDSVAFVAFNPDHDIAAEDIPNHFAWVVDSAAQGKYVAHVPSLIVISQTGRVLSVAQSSLIRAAKLLDLYSLLPKQRVDSAIAFALRGVARTAAVSASDAAALPSAGDTARAVGTQP
jgi:hypothetical protein